MFVRLLDGQYCCVHCPFGTMRKIDWFGHMKSVHGNEYDRLVRQQRVASQHSRSADANSTTTTATMMMMTTTEAHGATGSIEVIKVNYNSIIYQYDSN